MTLPPFPHRPIRSFVRREGRMTAAQQRALATLLPRYGVAEGEAHLDLAQLFGRVAPVTLEIGFGNGEALALLAAAHPDRNYLGVEVHRPGVGHLLQRLETGAIGNVRVLCADATEVLRQRLADGSLAAVHLWFPDPWPKKRHHKRRIVQPDFVALLAKKLVPGGELHFATDWQEYAEHMLSVLLAEPALENLAAGFGERGERPVTKFERRGSRLGHAAWDLRFRRRAAQP